jgi:hypothetical protein
MNGSLSRLNCLPDCAIEPCTRTSLALPPQRGDRRNESCSSPKLVGEDSPRDDSPGWLVRTAVHGVPPHSMEKTRSRSTAHTCERVTTSVARQTLGRPTRLGGSCDRDLERNDGAFAAGAANGE